EDLRTRLGDKHPDVEHLKKALALYQQISNQGISLLNIDPTGGDPNKKADVLDVVLRAMRLEIQNYKSLIDMHDEMITQDERQAKDLADLDLQDQGYREDIKTTRELLNGIAKQLQVTEWIKDVGGYEAKTIAGAGGLGAKVAPRAIQVFPIAAIAGLLA